MMTSQTFLSCDWGTSNFRLRLIRSTDLFVLGEITNNDGIARVYYQWKNELGKSIDRMELFGNKLLFYVDQLEKQVGRSLQGIPLFVSGMASSSIGLKELPYKQVPFSLENDPLVVEKVSLKKVQNNNEFPAVNKLAHENELPGNSVMFTDLFLISGICSGNDVIRGEETLLVGSYGENNNDTSIYIFPGTHSKHVYVKKGFIKGFKTFMTGEMFNLLSEQSILADSLEKNKFMNTNEFQKGVREGVSSNFLNAIFHVRTNQVFKNNSLAENYHYLSGLLIGYELSGLLNSEIQHIILVSGETLKEQYLLGLHTIGMKNISFVDADAALVKGHSKLSTFAK